MKLEEFRKIKQEMKELFNKFEEMNEEEKENEEITEQIVQKFYELQSKLLESDLSSIPFEEWKGITLSFDGELDFSKTHANIDFSLLEDIYFDSINLTGCNVRGIDRLDFDENTFDEEFIRNHPEYFPDENVPEEIKKKFFQQKLEFSDLIEYPSLKKCVNKNSFGSYHNASSASLVKAIGLESALKLFEENPQFIKYITTKKNEYSSNNISFTNNKLNEDASYEEKKEFVYKCVIDSIKSGFNRIDFPPLEIIPEDMKQKFPSAFVTEEELPEEVVANYYNGELSIGDIREYQDVLKNKEIEIGSRHSYTVYGVERVFNSVWDFIDKVPKELDYIVSNYLNSIYDNDELDQIKVMELKDLFANAIRSVISENKDLKSIENLAIYCKYLPIEEAIPNEVVRNFIEKCGLSRLQDYNKKNNYILNEALYYFSSYDETLFGNMAKYSNQIQEENVINSEEDLTRYLEKIINVMRINSDYEARTIINKSKKELSNIFPNQFINYDLAEKILNNIREYERDDILSNLEFGFNGHIDSLIHIINKYPELVPCIENKEMIIGDNKPLYKKMKETLGNKKFLEIISIYGESLNQIINIVSEESFENLLNELSNTENYNDILDNKIYELITPIRNFDIRILPDSFKKTHPELYLSENAPDALQRLFYGMFWNSSAHICPADLQGHPEWIEYLKHIDLEKLFEKKKINIKNKKIGIN